jgi:hypothetical protein
MNEPETKSDFDDGVTKTNVEKEDWTGNLKYPKTNVECVNSHVFYAHGKFSGRLIALISHTPCPVCGQYQLRRISSEPEVQTLAESDKGKIDDL